MRGQISVFVVAGLIILLVTGIAFYVYRMDAAGLDTELEKQYTITSSMAPLRLYIETCLEEVAREPIENIGLFGGNLALDDYRWYDGQVYSYLCHEENSCVQVPRFRQDMELELEEEIIEKLPECIDLSIFERQGFVVNSKNPRLNITIGKDHIGLKLNYPIRLIRDDFDMHVDTYISEIRKPLGLLYDKAIEIINLENIQGHYNHIDSMYFNGNSISIEKHRPYPDIIYNLTSDDYVFRFAMGGSDSEKQGMPYGCCYNLYDKNCFKNVPQSVCYEKGGIYDFNPYCICPSLNPTYTVACNGEECSDCEKTYDYVSKKFIGEKHLHGESWCEYEGIAGKGFDFVGSRHYVHYCIDGREYVEECMDFREELCTEEIAVRENEKHIEAVCRPNRWQDCHKCLTEECCKDTTYRDCDWKEYLNTETQCVPYVPPGFRFWEYDGVETCSLASETKECEGFSCPNIWVDDTALRCYMQGDCGNYRNYVDVLSKGGFFNSDFADKVRDYVYLDEGFAKKGKEYSISLGKDCSQAVLFSSVEDAGSHFMRLTNTVLEYINRLSELSASDFLNPFDKPDISMLDIAICDVWHAPNWGDCSICTDDLLHPCTEYKCKSLGKVCEYSENKGIPICKVKDEKDNTPPEVNIGILTPAYSIDKDDMKIIDTEYSGFHISPMLAPHRIVAIQLNTTEESICRIKYLPKLKYISSPSYYFGKGSYTLVHNVTMRIPEKLPVPTKLLDIFNITSMIDFTSLLDEPEKLIETYIEKYRSQLELFEKITGKDLVETIDKYADKVTVLISKASDTIQFYKELFRHLLGSYENGEYYLFLSCMDKAGNTNDDIFIRFGINDSEDVNPPLIIGFLPENNSLAAVSEISMFIDEPAVCRYDFHDLLFENMTRVFSCDERSTKFGGSYRCRTTEQVFPIYIRCRDQPGDVYEKQIVVEKSKTAGVVGTTSTGRMNASDSEIYTPLKMLHDGIRFRVVEEDIWLNIFIDDSLSCSLGNVSFECMPTTQLELGHYMCRALFSLAGNETLESLEFAIDIINGDGDNPAGVDYEANTLVVNNPEDTIAYVNKSEVNFELHLNGTYNCHGLNCVQKNTTVCYKQLSVGKHNITCIESLPKGYKGRATITCKEEIMRNTHEKSIEYLLRRIPGVRILNAGPEGETASTVVLYSETSIPAMCGYYQDLQLGTILMQNLTTRIHQAQIEAKLGENVYYITCRDEFGNTDTERIEFFVI